MNRSQYFTFLYDECKRSSNARIDSNEINQFIDSPEGQKGFRAFCAKHSPTPTKSRLKPISTILESIQL